ncbi:hypothetical protein Tco_0656179 [Tanacetum coccineum]|uniref:Uncharacterized protein n=1 Tax=Tanacetum coccineum TaxID=301880 RepID=A0ABQ4X814_9ASTR
MSIFALTSSTITKQLCSPPHDQNQSLSILTKLHSVFTRTTPHEESSFSALSVSSWTSSVAHYCRTGSLEQVAADFPSHALSFAASLHCLICKLGYDTDNVRVGTAIIDML